MVEARIAPRYRASKAATIEFVGGAIDCIGPRPVDYRSGANGVRRNRHPRKIQTGCAWRRIMSAMPCRLAQRISDGCGFRLASSVGNLFQSPPRWRSLTNYGPPATLHFMRWTVAYGPPPHGEACAAPRRP